jgi:hypothetical protein
VKQVTARAPAKLSLFRAATIRIILRAVCFRGVLSAYFAQLLAAPGPWQSVQFRLRDAEMKPIVSMNSSTGIPFKIWMSLKTSSAICGLCVCAVWPLAEVTASRHTIAVAIAPGAIGLEPDLMLNFLGQEPNLGRG